MNLFRQFWLFMAIHAVRELPLKRTTRSIKAGSVLIENKTNDLLKVYIE